MKGKKIISTLLALLLLASLPVSALAAEWDIGKGDITVNAESGGQTVTQGGGAAVPDSAPVITGTSKENNVTINADSGQTASVTLSGVNIDVRDKGKAAVSTTGEGNVSIELNGGSTLRSGYEHAGLEKNNGGSLTIADEDKNGKLTAWGGQQGAGIGGGQHGSGSNIFITGGGVNAIGGLAAAGIGGGLGGNGSNITISGGKVGATNGLNGAGIGGGQHGSGSNITISGGEVNASGGKSGAGIGGGLDGNGSDIIISGGEVSASGGKNGAGIGGGVDGKGEGITVSGNAQLKVRGGSVHGDYGTGAGIGGGGSYGTDGAEVEPDICALNPSGKIEYYAPRSSMSGTPNKTVTNPTGDFVWDSGTVTTPATCTEKGVRTYTCTSSSHTKTEDIPALNHSFAGQEYVSDNNATCEQDGTKTAKCVRYGTGGCMETDTVTDTGSKLGHLFEDYVSNNDATCEQDGTKTAKCVRYGTGDCMETDTVTDTDSKLGHLFEDYVSNNDATYEHDGTKTAKCVRYDQCGETHTMPDEGSRLIAPPLYRVTDKDGRDIAYTAEQKGGVLTVTVDEDLAILTGRLSGIRTLKAQGVKDRLCHQGRSVRVPALRSAGQGRAAKPTGSPTTASPSRSRSAKNDRRERRSHQAVSDISKSIQAGRHKLCLPVLSVSNMLKRAPLRWALVWKGCGSPQRGFGAPPGAPLTAARVFPRKACKNQHFLTDVLVFLVPVAGVEPARPCGHGILSPGVCQFHHTGVWRHYTAEMCRWQEKIFRFRYSIFSVDMVI